MSSSNKSPSSNRRTRARESSSSENDNNSSSNTYYTSTSTRSRTKEDLEQQLLQGRKYWSTLPPINEKSQSVRNDPLLQSLLYSRKKSKQFDLFELYPHLDSMILALAGKTKAHIACQRICYSGIDPSTIEGKPLGYTALRKGFQDYAIFLERSFSLEIFQHIPNDMREEFARNTIKMLGPESKFDEAHKMQSMQEMMRLSMQTAGLGAAKKVGNANTQNSDGQVQAPTTDAMDPIKMEEEFEATNPIQIHHQDVEPGYKDAVKQIFQYKEKGDAQKFYEMGRNAWRLRRKWTAEICFDRATFLDPTHAKYFSNLATVRISLGRFLRSREIGYRRLAANLIRHAIKAAEMGMEVDPSWERTYQRAAEAYLTLGPYEHALDACRVLKKAMDVLEHPSEVLVELQSKAKRNAMLWCSLKVIPNKTTVPQIIEAALHSLRYVVMCSFPICYKDDPLDEEEVEKAGDQIAHAILAAHGALQLMYLRRTDWEVQSRDAKVVKMDYQIELRKVAKVLPLPTLTQSEMLRKIVFVEEPYTLWGLDRLDRLRVEFLEMEVEDPCDEDDAGDAFLNETATRAMGDGSLDMQTLTATMERMMGKRATSFDQDMAPHHLCALTMAILERLILSKNFPELKEAASKRLIDFALSSNKNQNALHMGGEFIGKAIMEATGREIYTKSRGRDSEQFYNFIKYNGGITTVCREIYNSGDPDQVLQRLLCLLTPEEWRKHPPYDIFYAFFSYILPGMEGAVQLKVSDIKPYVIDIMSNIFDAHPQIMNVLRSGCSTSDNSVLQILFALYKSSFGQFIVRNFFSEEKLLQDKGASDNTNNVIKSLAEKWQSLSKKKKSAYRWESLSMDTKRRLSNLEPISRMDKFEKKAASIPHPRASSSRRNSTKAKASATATTCRPAQQADSFRDSYENRLLVTELPKCATCNKQAGMGVELRQCPCKLVYYCDSECQKIHWPQHKRAHKKAMALANGK